MSNDGTGGRHHWWRIVDSGEHWLWVVTILSVRVGGGSVDLLLSLSDDGENVVPCPRWTWWVLVVGHWCQCQGGGE